MPFANSFATFAAVSPRGRGLFQSGVLVARLTLTFVGFFRAFEVTFCLCRRACFAAGSAFCAGSTASVALAGDSFAVVA